MFMYFLYAMLLLLITKIILGGGIKPSVSCWYRKTITTFNVQSSRGTVLFSYNSMSSDVFYSSDTTLITSFYTV